MLPHTYITVVEKEQRRTNCVPLAAAVSEKIHLGLNSEHIKPVTFTMVKLKVSVSLACSVQYY